jgi:hypothetical protein
MGKDMQLNKGDLGKRIASIACATASSNRETKLLSAVILSVPA